MDPEVKLYFEIARLVISALTLIVLPLSIWIAYHNLKNTQVKNQTDNDFRHDKEIVEQCILSITRAYDVLEVESDKNTPKSSRLNWLSSARMLLRYELLRKEVRTELYKTICDEHEEFWRHKFYQYLDSKKLTLEYFSPSRTKDDLNNIDSRSAMVVLGFTRWKQDSIDPIHDFDARSAIIDDQIHLGSDDLEEYLSLYPQYKRLLDEINS